MSWSDSIYEHTTSDAEWLPPEISNTLVLWNIRYFILSNDSVIILKSLIQARVTYRLLVWNPVENLKNLLTLRTAIVAPIENGLVGAYIVFIKHLT